MVPGVGRRAVAEVARALHGGVRAVLDERGVAQQRDEPGAELQALEVVLLERGRRAVCALGGGLPLGARSLVHDDADGRRPVVQRDEPVPPRLICGRGGFA